jgi:3-phosphoshikimate 1-carboxyvinyltransferase
MTSPHPTADNTPDTVTVRGPGRFSGRLQVPGDKSISHRALILGALGAGTSRITGLSDGADVRHTLAAVRALGADVRVDEAGVWVSGGRLTEPDGVIDVGNSGTGIRLLAGVAAAIDGLTVLLGDESIARRPMDRIAVPLRQMGAAIDGRSGGRYPPLAVRGGALRGIDYVSPVASAQVKSAILLAGLSADGATVVREPTRSRAHTEQMLVARGADLTVDGATVTLRPSTLAARDERVPGDPSQAAFWLVGGAALPGSELTVEGIYLGPARGGFLEVLRRMGADLDVTAEPDGSASVHVRGTQLTATDVDPDEIAGLVDEVPALSVAAALAEGVTAIRGAAELRVKESDRIATTAEMLRGFGVAVDELDDGLVIHGGAQLSAAQVDSRGDHRIAMAAAIAAIAAEGTSTIRGFAAVATSYPTFLADLDACAPAAR